MPIRSVLFVAGAFWLQGCGPSATSLEEARKAVTTAEQQWAAAAQARDLERSVSFMAEDATMFPPGSAPIVGKAAIREYVAGAFATPGFSVTWEPVAVVVAESGDLAYTHARSIYTVPGPEGQVMTIHAKGVAIWRKDGDGIWRCIIDIWNDAPAPQLQSRAEEVP